MEKFVFFADSIQPKGRKVYNIHGLEVQQTQRGSGRGTQEASTDQTQRESGRRTQEAITVSVKLSSTREKVTDVWQRLIDKDNAKLVRLNAESPSDSMALGKLKLPRRVFTTSSRRMREEENFNKETNTKFDQQKSDWQSRQQTAGHKKEVVRVNGQIWVARSMMLEDRRVI